MQRLSHCASRQYHGQISRGIYLLCLQSLSTSRRSFTTSNTALARQDGRRTSRSTPQQYRVPRTQEELKQLGIQLEKELDEDEAEEAFEDLDDDKIQVPGLRQIGLGAPVSDELESLGEGDQEQDELLRLQSFTDIDAAEREGLEALDTRKYGHLEDPQTRELRKRILQLEAELSEMQSEKSLASLSAQDNNEADEGPGEAQAAGMAAIQSQLSQGVNQVLPEHDIKLQDFNKCLADASITLSSFSVAQNLWRSYSLCKHSVPSFFKHIPERAWEVLWESQYRAQGASRDSAKHLTSLLEDMIQSKVALTPAQKLVYLESLAAQGRYSEAILNWQQNKFELQSNKDTAQYFEDLGVQIYASAGNLQVAQNLAFEYLTGRNNARARILTPVISGWIKQGNEMSDKQAWAVYLRLRAHLGSTITLEDYDEITSCLLDAGKPRFALAVFKDLMLTGKSSNWDSMALYKKSMSLYGELVSQSESVEDLSKVSLTSLMALPRNFHNKFFFASWIKKLLGMGKIDAAIAVLELMVERRIRADAKHLNGVIAALFRSGSAKNAQQALKFGWAMIEERLDVVAKRREQISTPSSFEDPQPITVPAATIETFAILLLYFTRRSMQGSVQELVKKLRAAEIAPNSYFMNHLIYAELRQGKFDEAWKIYETLTSKTRPDLETFAALWDCKKAQLDQLAAIRRAAKFPGTREIFFNMTNWFFQRSPKERSLIVEDFSRDLYMQIVRCIGYEKDIQGTLVALHALKHTFRLYPDDETARLITLQISRLGEAQSGVPKRRRHKGVVKENAVANVKRVTQILKILAEKRDEALRARNILKETMNQQELAEESLWRLTELLRSCLQGMGLSDEALEESLQQAAREMGIEGIRFGDDPFLSSSGVGKIEGQGPLEVQGVAM